MGSAYVGSGFLTAGALAKVVSRTLWPSRLVLHADVAGNDSVPLWVTVERMYIALAIAAGAGLAFQAVINSRLRTVLDSALWAATVQVLVGLVMLAAVVAIAREPMPGGSISRVPWWAWTGGLLGSFYVLTAIVTTVPLGAALTVAAIVVGQTLAALVIDHYGWFGLEVQRLSPVRLLGALMLVGGVVLMRVR